MGRRVSTTVLALALGTPLVAQDPPLPARDPFLAQVRANLQTDRRLLSQYTYLERRSEIHLTKLGKLTAGPVKVYQVYPGLDPDDRYRRLIEVDGKPRDLAELEKEDRRHQKSVFEKLSKLEHESAGEGEKRLRREAKSKQEEQEMLDDLLRTYTFTLVERQMRDLRSTIVVDFAPKRDAAPTTDYGKLMKKVKGRVWISENDYQIVRVEVELLDDLSVGLGLLGKLYKGTTASFDRGKINDEVWLPAEARFNGSGRAFVRRFRIDTVVRYPDYRKFSVETDRASTLPKPPCGGRARRPARLRADRLACRRPSHRQRRERDECQRGRCEERVPIVAKPVEHACRKPRTENAGRPPRRKEQAVVHSEVTRAVEVGGRRRKHGQLGAVAPVHERDERVERHDLLTP
jgi:hypothetical protein